MNYIRANIQYTSSYYLSEAGPCFTFDNPYQGPCFRTFPSYCQVNVDKFGAQCCHVSLNCPGLAYRAGRQCPWASSFLRYEARLVYTWSSYVTAQVMGNLLAADPVLSALPSLSTPNATRVQCLILLPLPVYTCIPRGFDGRNIAVKTRSDSHARKSLAPVVSEKCPR